MSVSRVRVNGTLNVLRQLEPFIIAFIVVGVLGLVADVVFLDNQGIKQIPHDWHHYLPQTLELIVVMSVSNESILNGFTSAQERWRRNWKLILFLITGVVGIRMISGTISALITGVEEAVLAGAANTATDPVGIILILTLVAVLQKIPVIAEFTWVMAIDSVANDGVSRVVFSVVSGQSRYEIEQMLIETAGLGIVLAVTDFLVRRYIRESSPWRNTPREAQIEVVVMLLIYGLFGLAAFRYHATPILVGVLGGLVGDYLVHGIRATREVNVHIAELREKYYHRWAVAGLLVAEFVVILLVPFDEMTPERLLRVGVINVLILGLARLGWEYYYERRCARLGIPRDPRLKWAAMLLAMTLLGVPSVNAAHSYTHGHVELSYDLYAMILMSWVISIPASIWYLSRMGRQMAKEVGLELASSNAH